MTTRQYHKAAAAVLLDRFGINTISAWASQLYRQRHYCHLLHRPRGLHATFVLQGATSCEAEN
jgi:hypothetical protein